MVVTAIFAKPGPVVMGPCFRRDDTEVLGAKLPLKGRQHRAQHQHRGRNIQRIRETAERISDGADRDWP